MVCSGNRPANDGRPPVPRTPPFPPLFVRFSIGERWTATGVADASWGVGPWACKQAASCRRLRDRMLVRFARPLARSLPRSQPLPAALVRGRGGRFRCISTSAARCSNNHIQTNLSRSVSGLDINWSESSIIAPPCPLPFRLLVRTTQDTHTKPACAPVSRLPSESSDTSTAETPTALPCLASARKSGNPTRTHVSLPVEGIARDRKARAPKSPSSSSRWMLLSL
jgi:hypothetical protein